MKQRITYLLIWLAISAAAGAVVWLLFRINFWVGSAVMFGALTVHGMLLGRNDRL